MKFMKPGFLNDREKSGFLDNDKEDAFWDDRGSGFLDAKERSCQDC
jgi:hypothetical protein